MKVSMNRRSTTLLQKKRGTTVLAGAAKGVNLKVLGENGGATTDGGHSNLANKAAFRGD